MWLNQPDFCIGITSKSDIEIVKEIWKTMQRQILGFKKKFCVYFIYFQGLLN